MKLIKWTFDPDIVCLYIIQGVVGERGEDSAGGMVQTLEFLKNVWDPGRRDSTRNCETLFTSGPCFVIQLGRKT